LSRSFDRIEAFLSPRILHLHVKLTCGIDVGKEGMYNPLCNYSGGRMQKTTREKREHGSIGKREGGN